MNLRARKRAEEGDNSLSKKPQGFFKKRDKSGRMVTHPVTGKKPRPYQEPPMKVYKVETPPSIWKRMEIELKKRRAEDERKLAQLNLKREQELEIREILTRCRSSDEVKSSMAKADLEKKYPRVYRHLFQEQPMKPPLEEPKKKFHFPSLKKKPEEEKVVEKAKEPEEKEEPKEAEPPEEDSEEKSDEEEEKTEEAPKEEESE